MKGLIRWMLMCSVIILMGCTTTKYITKPIDMPTLPERPELLLSKLSTNSTPKQTAIAYQQSVDALFWYSIQLENVLQTIRELNESQTNENVSGISK